LYYICLLLVISSLAKFVIFLILALLLIPKLEIFTNASTSIINRWRRIFICVQEKYIKIFKITSKVRPSIGKGSLREEIQAIYRYYTSLKIINWGLIIWLIFVAFYVSPFLTP
jgi:hypothetical protein